MDQPLGNYCKHADEWRNNANLFCMQTHTYCQIFLLIYEMHFCLGMLFCYSYDKNVLILTHLFEIGPCGMLLILIILYYIFFLSIATYMDLQPIIPLESCSHIQSIQFPSVFKTVLEPVPQSANKFRRILQVQIL